MTEATAEQNVETTAPATMADIAAGITTPAAETAKVASTDDNGGKAAGPGGNQDDMRDFIASQNKAMSEMRTTLESTSQAVTNLTDREKQLVLDQAVDSAVSTINDGDIGNADLAESFLNSQYAKNPHLQKIFDNRGENPEALSKALGILKTEWTAMNTKQIDSQVAENQRALQESQQKGGTPQGEDTSARFDKMGDGEFMREMRKLAQSN